MSTIQNDAINRVTADSVSAKNAIKGKSAEDMGMNEFFSLLTAQMTNQDMMNPESNTEFIAQMAQFSALKGVQTIQENQLAAYAVSYAGKEVTIAEINKSGDLEKITGIVEKVTFFDGQPQVMVNGKAYPLHQIMEINSGTDTKTQNEQAAGSALSMVAGYIGKMVTVTDVDENGWVRDLTQEVKSVTLIGGKPYVILENGKEYAYSDISSVMDKPQETETNGTGNGTGTDNKTETDNKTGTEDETGSVKETETDTDDTGTNPDPDDETGANPDPEE